MHDRVSPSEKGAFADKCYKVDRNKANASMFRVFTKNENKMGKTSCLHAKASLSQNTCISRKPSISIPFTAQHENTTRYNILKIQDKRADIHCTLGKWLPQ